MCGGVRMTFLLCAVLVAAVLPVRVAMVDAPAQSGTVERARPRPGAQSRHATPHLEVMTSLSDKTVRPGQRFRITLDITPKPGIHVYAPGKHDYRVIALRIDPSPRLRAHPLKYPESVEYVFEPLNERVQVYDRRFQLVQELEAIASPRPAQTTATALTLSGVLAYQACTDTICYPPEQIPLTWVVALQPQGQGVK